MPLPGLFAQSRGFVVPNYSTFALICPVAAAVGKGPEIFEQGKGKTKGREA